MQAADSLSGFAVVEQAPAKINLALSVVGRREDGYHLLDSLVTFTAFGDRLGFSPAPEDRFTISGRFGAALDADGDNLVTRARDRLRAALAEQGQDAPPARIHLEKNLPIASGIGGGSADAAAALRGLLTLWQGGLPQGALDAIAVGLGADVPMCLAGRPLIARGIGEDITPVALPAMSVVLANPLVGVSTPAVFKALASRNNPPLDLETHPADWLSAIARLRNDLEPPARQLCPEIAIIAEGLAATDARVVRMSGSGATCFALYLSPEAAEAAAAALSRKHPRWFFAATTTLGDADGEA
ncbi:4-(cytidine 5'-diphospho)-2-C-methyl-D-erythritol kinase [Shinella sp. CPCC 101442]|uniref:4-(cytidine 5'-diphospho)-2-C-methyl-D-erythritol kinase n=1 Tax=Shinella sp. CPCC 101442 TaxID=2932265 RepID=UPI002151FF57|nr:4-(cytidine 5'-diphospho)-2-C-methyl-D-erythritol kinase [Shinella sp. CPCC 101442]MCR6499222.1 4-(cytidine 5'-diphospho)-2-C-methyl-D-erythritol kinase [Shinella sp. CPCC 101442]